MKIISKHKDYYDYLQGIYGMDTVISYDRRNLPMIKQSEYLNSEEITIKDFAICGNIIRMHYYDNKTYHSVDELIELDSIIRKKTDNHKYLFYTYSWEKNNLSDAQNYYKNHNKKTNVNVELREPILIDNGYYNEKNKGKEYENIEWCIPHLGSFDMARIITPEKMFIDVSNFMGYLVDNPPIPENMTDKDKIHSHGFDNKISFRHRKK